MPTNHKPMRSNISSILGILTLPYLVASALASPTILQGNVSGTWDIAGSPYTLIDDCTVPTGSRLVIDPGVEVVIAQSKALNINGQILAVGTSEQPITFRAASGKYARVYVINGSASPPISEFTHCRFRDAEYGLYLHAYGRIDNSVTTLETKVTQCEFQKNKTGIYAAAQAVDASQFMTPRRRSAGVNPSITNCRFIDNESGIVIQAQGAGAAYYSGGAAVATVMNCYFHNQSATAVALLPGALNSGTLNLVNNTIRNDGQGRGLWVQDGDYDAVIRNNVFVGTVTAIERTGTSSGTCFYNCFFANQNNFVGYPASYGDIVAVNLNGTPADLGQNIFVDPGFLSQTDAHLGEGSPCIDAAASVLAPSSDYDGDGRPQLARFDIGADEFVKISDRDHDGLLDPFETKTGTYASPTNTGTDPDNPDTDGDGLSDGAEVRQHSTNPNVADTDGDGFTDGFELDTGFDPLLTTSTPDMYSWIRTAVEFRFASLRGESYRIEASIDLKNWTIIEDGIAGTGGMVVRFYSTEGQPRRTFRTRRN